MSSSYIVEPQEGRQDSNRKEKRDPLIFMVNDKGEIMADKVTLQTLMNNQDNAPISVVRISNEGVTEGTLTLIVDPPDILKNSVNLSIDSGTSSDSSSSRSEPEQHDIRITQNSEVSQVFDDNVSALLTMLTLEDEKNCMRYNIKWDHCYTNKHQSLVSTQAKSSDVTPIIDISKKPTGNNLSQCKISSKVESNNNRNSNILAKLEKVEKISKLYTKPRNSSRPQRTIVLKNPVKYYSESEKIDELVDDEIDVDEPLFSSSESFTSENSSFSDNDSFKKPASLVIQSVKTKSQATKNEDKNIPCRQGSKKELILIDRTLQNKLKFNKSLCHDKKLIKVSSQENKNAFIPKATEENSSLCPIDINAYQTKNQVKANLIKSNMFEGSMILTKPGEGKKNINTEKKKLSDNLRGSKNFKLKQEEILKDQIVKFSHPKVHSSKDNLSNSKINDTSKKTSTDKILEKPEKKLPEVSVTKAVKKIKIKSNIVLDSSLNLNPVVVKVKKDFQKPHILPKRASEPDLFSTPDIIKRVNCTSENYVSSTTNKKVDFVVLSNAKNKLSTFSRETLCPVNTKESMETVLLTDDDKNQPNDLNDFLENIDNSAINSNHLIRPVNEMEIFQESGVNKLEESKPSSEDEFQNKLFKLQELLFQEKLKQEKTFNSELEVSQDSNVFSNVSLSSISSEKNSLNTTVPCTETDSLDSELSKSEVDLTAAAKYSPKDENLENIEEFLPAARNSPVEIESSTFLNTVMNTSIIKDFSHSLRDHLITTNFSVKAMQQSDGLEFDSAPKVYTDNEQFSYSEADSTSKIHSEIEHYLHPKITSAKVNDDLPFNPVSLVVMGPLSNSEPVLSTDAEETVPFPSSTTDPDAKFLPKATSSPVHKNCQSSESKPNQTKLPESETSVSTTFIKQQFNKLKSRAESKIPVIIKDEKVKIKLPPMEAPVTRRRRKTERSKANDKQPEAKEEPSLEKQPPKVEPLTLTLQNSRSKRKIYHVSSKKSDMEYNYVEEILEPEDAANSTEEEDPSKLWCICNKPNDGRLMICCDKCDQWFHADCVGIEKSMAISMEKRGIQWICPECNKKNNKKLKKSKSNLKNRRDLSGSVKSVVTNASATIIHPDIGSSKTTNLKKKLCKFCSKNLARVNSSYCSDACIMEESTPKKKDKIIQKNFNPSSKIKDAITQKVSAGPNDSQKTNQKHVSTEAKPSRDPKQREKRKSTKTKDTKAPPKESDAQPEIRTKVRENLAELLTSRLKDQNEINLSEEEVTELAVQIELEMFKFFKDTGHKYKAKYRSLVFNIKDTKNLTLYRKIADKSLTPAAVVKLSPEEMASQELAEWREKETKHQLEMIKKNELDVLAATKPRILKTHKGEEIVENNCSEYINSSEPITEIDSAFQCKERETLPDECKQKEEIKLSDSTFQSTEIETSLNKSKSVNEEIKLSKESIETVEQKKIQEVDNEKQRNRDREKRSKKCRSKSSHKHNKDKETGEKVKSKKEYKRKHEDRDRSKDEPEFRNEKARDMSSNEKHHENRSKDHSRDKHKKDRKRSKDRSSSEHKSRHKSIRNRDKSNREDKIRGKKRKLDDHSKTEDKSEELDTKKVDENDSIKKLKQNESHKDAKIDCPYQILINMQKIHGNNETLDSLKNDIKLNVPETNESFCNTTKIVAPDNIEKKLVKNFGTYDTNNPSINNDRSPCLSEAIETQNQSKKFNENFSEPQTSETNFDWQGTINTPDMPKFFVIAENVSGNFEKLSSKKRSAESILPSTMPEKILKNENLELQGNFSESFSIKECSNEMYKLEENNVVSSEFFSVDLSNKYTLESSSNTDAIKIDYSNYLHVSSSSTSEEKKSLELQNEIKKSNEQIELEKQGTNNIGIITCDNLPSNEALSNIYMIDDGKAVANIGSNLESFELHSKSIRTESVPAEVHFNYADAPTGSIQEEGSKIIPPNLGNPSTDFEFVPIGISDIMSTNVTATEKVQGIFESTDH